MKHISHSGRGSSFYLSLFWLRQTTNLVMQLAEYVLLGKTSYRGDEIKLALRLDLPV